MPEIRLSDQCKPSLTPRFQRPSWLSTASFALFLGFFLWSLAGAGMSISDLIGGLPNMGTIAGEMFPPATDRAGPIMEAILVTFQMALVGTDQSHLKGHQNGLHNRTGTVGCWWKHLAGNCSHIGQTTYQVADGHAGTGE